MVVTGKPPFADGRGARVLGGAWCSTVMAPEVLRNRNRAERSKRMEREFRQRDPEREKVSD